MFYNNLAGLSGYDPETLASKTSVISIFTTSQINPSVINTQLTSWHINPWTTIDADVPSLIILYSSTSTKVTFTLVSTSYSLKKLSPVALNSL